MREGEIRKKKVGIRCAYLFIYCFTMSSLPAIKRPQMRTLLLLKPWTCMIVVFIDDYFFLL